MSFAHNGKAYDNDKGFRTVKSCSDLNKSERYNWSGEANAEPGSQKTWTYEEKQMQVQNTQTEILRKSLQLLNETEETATDTASKLYEQRSFFKKKILTVLINTLNVAERVRKGEKHNFFLIKKKEQLERIDRTLHETGEHLTHTEYILRGMKSWSGQISNWFRKAPKNERSSDQKFTKQAVLEKQQLRRDTKQSDDDMPTETDEQLDQVLQGVKRLQTIAHDINSELTEQSEVTENISENIDIVQGRLKSQNRTMNRIG
ncbi:hypothetical protein RFI_01194 [Reticulomyxa filosa]|uniref:t-SNARE coiled-coil homology domain-containing protein n=1 Tax=Reticulomyxa filosa TaxID=46433 RepID=X6PCR8_RETFI|nr:hypothetical protein RFI_01194 [Reticulomyxa filosa]|eukprot:ETO35868.1 hypothetical protein RFI_01194 [Reticulomyxa filosa]